MCSTIPFTRRLLGFLLILAVLNLQVSCSYYKVRTRPSPDKADVAARAVQPDKYIIIHQGTDAWHLKGIAMNSEQTEMTGTLEELPSDHLSYLHPQPVNRPARGPIRYRPQRSKPTQEIHIYLNEESFTATEGLVHIPISGVRKIDIYDEAVGATVASYVFTTLGVIAAAVVIIGVIALATKSSCPFVYVNNKGAWQFTGEMYGGAIALPLVRDDYMPLPAIQPENGTYDIKIANELQERQYTDVAELMVVDHPANTTMLVDKQGRLQTIAHAAPPMSAVAGQHILTDGLAARDDKAYLFDVPDPENAALSNVVMTFRKPAGASAAKLVLNAKNSYWLDYMFGRFTAQFGTEYNAFAESQKKVPAAESRQWSLDQGIPLSVYVQTSAGWERAGYFDVMGPLASRDIVMPLDLHGVAGSEVKIRLQCGRMFWEVNYAALDFSENLPLVVNHIKPSCAIDETGKDVRALLTATDNQYLVQPSVGNAVVASYSAPGTTAGTVRSIFLHTRGYYEYIRHYTNKPNLLKLYSFRKEGSFATYAAAYYNDLVHQKYFLATALHN